jgi:hypothetical protein
MKEHKTYIGVIILLVLALLFQSWRSQVREDNFVQKVITYSDLAQHYALKSGAQVATNTALSVSSQKQMNAFAASINDTIAKIAKRFKTVQNITYATNQFYTGGDTIKLKDSIPCNFAAKKVRHSDSTYTATGTISPTYFSIDSVYVPNKIGLVSGRKKIGFMKHDYGVDITNSNPKMYTSNITSYQFVPEKKWYERTIVHIFVGAALQTGVQLGANYLIKTQPWK